MAEVTRTLQRHKVHPEKSTPEETRALARLYREYRTGNATLAHLLRQRAEELDTEADEAESTEEVA